MLSRGDKKTASEAHMLYVKTDAGRLEVQARALTLTPSQRQVLILCNGERQEDDLLEMMPAETLKSALEQLCAHGLLEARKAAPRVKAEPVVLTEAERYRSVVELATSMVSELGFTARIKAQLQIEKAQSLQDLTGVVELLCKHLKSTPLMTLRLNKLRELTSA
jgi:phage terminase small subunit